MLAHLYRSEQAQAPVSAGMPPAPPPRATTQLPPFGGLKRRQPQPVGAQPAAGAQPLAMQAAANAGAMAGQARGGVAPMWEPGTIGQQLGGA